MIYNRTLDDVKSAKKLVDEKVKTFQELTEAETAILERGRFTINTINRIESKQTQLKIMFNDIGYYNVNIVNKSWGIGDFFSAKDLKRIVNNVIVLRNAFFVFKDTPNNPKAKYHYKEINSMEKVLYDLDRMTNLVVEYYNECGTFNCGEA